jgi:hypothetical protein
LCKRGLFGTPECCCSRASAAGERNFAMISFGTYVAAGGPAEADAEAAAMSGRIRYGRTALFAAPTLLRISTLKLSVIGLIRLYHLGGSKTSQIWSLWNRGGKFSGLALHSHGAAISMQQPSDRAKSAKLTVPSRLRSRPLHQSGLSQP